MKQPAQLILSALILLLGSAGCGTDTGDKAATGAPARELSAETKAKMDAVSTNNPKLPPQAQAMMKNQIQRDNGGR